MKTMRMGNKAGPESLVEGQIPLPGQEAGEVMIKVHATAATPTELQGFPTFNKKSGEPRPFPIVLSHEFSGAIESLGPGVKDTKVGAEVYGLNDLFANGAQADYREAHLLRPGGKGITIAAQSEGVADKRIRRAFMLVEANGSQLVEISRLIDAGALRVFLAETFY